MIVKKNIFYVYLISTCYLPSVWAMNMDEIDFIKSNPAKLAATSEDKENLETHYLSGIQSYKAKKYTDAFKSFKIAAEQGDPKSQCYLGSLYKNKEGVSAQGYSH